MPLADLSQVDGDILLNVSAHPDADAPRLRYAKILSDRGDPRGEFIRLQIELAKLGGDRDHPSWFPLASRAQRMVDQYRIAWMPTWSHSAAEQVLDYKFHRGFVELVTMRWDYFLEHADEIFSHAPIRHLNITCENEQSVPEDFFCSPKLERIRSLSLDRCGLGDAHIEGFAKSGFLRNLRWLSLVYNKVSFRGAKALAESQHLRKLSYVNLAGNPVDPCEQVDLDQGIVINRYLPKEGQELEQRYGYVPWLHREARSIDDMPPDRFFRKH
jgi:uncharacterized protein (TIGR02996 family)